MVEQQPNSRIAFSTGTLYKVFPTSQLERIHSLDKELGSDALIELFLWNQKTAVQMAYIKDSLVPSLLRSENLTIHLPRCVSGEFMYFDGTKKSKEAMNVFREINKRFHPSHFVIHPDWIANYAMFAGTDLPFALENTDPEWQQPKRFDTFVADGKRLVVDIGHILFMCTDDQQKLDLLTEFISRFQKELVEFHISDCQNGTGAHIPLATSPRRDLGGRMLSLILKESDGVLVVESPFTNNYSDEMKNELAYIKSFASR